MLCDMTEADGLSDYHLELDARDLAPGLDVYELAVEWREVWARTGRRLRSVDGAHLGWM
ncbi:hypothetical protein SAMN05444004_12019 [Jannaschia faecimaris]|uniref:Uncharacterized protein n=2 Tax=Jannaschia faecimaris TaxID=1244108 RepID=A0A1H3TW18_9RHOB|nr:hypothetical protein SAMN05444004_12019 [Jannaschia faecimaris]